ncbi:PP2C family serine/threonine-protein phosphatase [Streptomyces sp. VRA16 Mangrove soil]|uniref:PP2C family serine/threonine-protein phosphatase n=1 Tax=Streptomyces sp. VRA16 Mangrove soil TaxID=2817434 RepID=UPI001E5FFC67|nr:PP2C family serine/threonine-protein phosphatase [Streptomyces sp. VRA16 Mangrove soil]
MSVCPSCEEPLEESDRFCGACGYDLSSAPLAPVPDDRPASATTPPVPDAGPDASVEWPAAAGPSSGDSSDTPAPVHLPTDLEGTDSGGGELPTSGVRFDGVPDAPGTPDEVAEGDFPLAAPDPRTATPEEIEAATPPAGTKLCVACRAGQVDADGYCENCGHAQPRERDHMEQELGAVAAVSDRGLRHHRNEDAFAISSAALPDGSPAVVAVVCDGVSSATRPDDASLAATRAANESLHESLPRGTHPQQGMHEAIVAAAEAVNALAEEPATAREHKPHQNAPACTFVGSVVTRELLVVGWVGDSRAYWIPDDRSAPAARLTEDDSWAAQMVAAGLMSEAEAYADERAHAITGWLGADAYELEPHTASFKPDRPGVVVVCTDGLWNYAEAAEQMAQVVPADAATRPLHAAQVLVGHALDGGGHDNVTVAVLPFPGAWQGAGSA